MMGVGKSTIGSLLSKKLEIPFEDLDNKIEARESLGIKKIFDLKGEEYFRKIEENEGLNIIKGSGKIIALGGGTFVNQKVREEVKKSCFSVWLDLGLEEIFSRIKKNKGRPLLVNAESIKDVEKIYLNRKKIYALADYRLNCASKSKEKIANEIEKVYENI
tara:strand:- start:96 stop:578 length:483 start_codon:yes stop_codon:yes gene_type:complete